MKVSMGLSWWLGWYKIKRNLVHGRLCKFDCIHVCGCDRSHARDMTKHTVFRPEEGKAPSKLCTNQLFGSHSSSLNVQHRATQFFPSWILNRKNTALSACLVCVGTRLACWDRAWNSGPLGCLQQLWGLGTVLPLKIAENWDLCPRFSTELVFEASYSAKARAHRLTTNYVQKWGVLSAQGLNSKHDEFSMFVLMSRGGRPGLFAAALETKWNEHDNQPKKSNNL